MAKYRHCSPIFEHNKYTCWYDSIITRAKSEHRVKGGGIYYESHHINPEALGGTNHKCNMVFLTAREHFLVHQLLPKMVLGDMKYKMLHAFVSMARCGDNQGRRLTAHQYSLVANANAEAMRALHIGKPKTAEHNAKVSEALRGRPKSEEHKKKLAAANIGKTLSAEHRAAIGAGCKNPSAEARAKMSAAHKGTKWSPERIAKRSETRRLNNLKHTSSTV